MKPECVAFRDVAPELALGIAVGDERAAALDHLAGCDECRHALARLTETVDAVVHTAPSVEPPSGFEVRALASFDAAAPVATGGRSSWRRVALVAATLLVVLGLAAAIGAIATRGSDVDQTADRSTAALQTPGGVDVGSVRLERSASGTSDLVVSVDAGARPGTYRVECDYESGGPYRAGELEIGSDGVDEWRTTVSVPTYDLSRVRLVSTGEGDNLEAEFGT